MQTHKKKNAPKRPEVRSLKIQPKFRPRARNYVSVPEIRFSGNWLSNLGFEIDDRVVITTMNKLLIIRLQEE